MHRLEQILLAFFCWAFLATAGAPSAVADEVNIAHLERAKSYVRHKQYKQAYHHFRRMAEHGCPYSQCIVGLMHKRGIGAKKDDHEAFLWFEKAASQGLADAKRWLGHAYAEGVGVLKNPELAEKYLSEAAAQDIHEAKLELAHLYAASGIPAQLEKSKVMLAELENRAPSADAGAMQQLSPESYNSGDNSFASGLKNLTQSWGGYVTVTRSIQKEMN